MRKLTVLNIVLALVACIVLGKITASLVSVHLFRSLPAAAARPAPRPSGPAMEPLGAYAPILEKGLFGKAARGKLTPIKSSAAVNRPSGTPGDLVLLGTAIGSHHETFALVQRSATGEERVFRLGDTVFDLGRLVEVKRNSMVVLVSGRRVTILTPDAAPGEVSKEGGRVVAVPGGYLVDQRALNAALDDMGRAITDARLLPSMKDGVMEGFRVSEVKPSGIFAMVGIRNGDTLLRINNFSIDSPDKAMQALSSLRGQTRISLDLVREGRPLTLTYEIR